MNGNDAMLVIGVLVFLGVGIYLGKEAYRDAREIDEQVGLRMRLRDETSTAPLGEIIRLLRAPERGSRTRGSKEGGLKVT